MKEGTDKRKDHGAMDEPFQNKFYKLDTITFLVWKIWSHSTSATRSYGRLSGRKAGKLADKIVLNLKN